MKKYIKKFFTHKEIKSGHNFIKQEVGFGVPIENFYISSKIANKKADHYKKNVVVYRCVNIIAQAVSHVGLSVYKMTSGGYQKNLNHHANFLLKNPNNFQSGFDLFNEIMSQKLLFGNAYILSVNPNLSSIPNELYSLHPECVRVIIEKGLPVGYKYKNDKIEKNYYLDKYSNKSNILHIKNFNPENEIYGVSCIEPANLSIDLHNKSSEWNSTLLKNGARPTGAIVMKNEDRFLTEEQFERLKSQLNEKYYGAANAGKPLLLEGGMDWKEMSISPKDMDFIESKNTAAREIALAFGVPPQLLGIKGDNTYSNMQEARIGLWEETIIPMLDELTDSLTNWFRYLYGEDLKIGFDKDSISIFSKKQHDLWKSLSDTTFMTTDEKRSIAGLPNIDCDLAGRVNKENQTSKLQNDRN